MKIGNLRVGLAAVVMGASLAAMGQAAGPSSVGKASTGKAPAYDVATIKPNDSGGGGTRVWIEQGTFTATNIPLKRLLEAAYGIKASLIYGVPDAMGGMMLDVEAKMLDPDPEALKKLRDKDKMLLLRPILEQRMGIKAHLETREQPVYELTTLPSGSKMKRVDGDGDGIVHFNGRELQLTNMDTGRIAGFLSDITGRTVIDQTGLKGAFDVDLKFTPEGAQQVNADDPPDIFTAVQEQLGLKLRGTKGPVQVLVVDAMTMPTGN